MLGEALTCPVTGLALIPAAGQTVFRLAKPSYGPLNPQCRTISSCDDRSSWNRFDLPGEQTIYAASNPDGAYGELLGRLKKPRPVPAARYLDDVGSATIEELITEDWAAAGKKLAPYVVDINWLYEFRLYTLTLPEQGWLVESEHSRTVNFFAEQHPGRFVGARHSPRHSVDPALRGSLRDNTFGRAAGAVPGRRRQYAAGPALWIETRQRVGLLDGVAA